MDIPIRYLLIFDFDETLTKRHLVVQYGDNLEKFNKEYGNNPKDFQKTFFNDFDSMKEIFQKLVNSGVKLCIASFGYQIMLERFIELSYGFDLFNKNDIVGTNNLTDAAKSDLCPYNDKYKGNFCKNQIITKFIEKYKVENKNVIFLDDYEFNVESAKKKKILPDENCILVTKNSLFPKDIINAVANFKDPSLIAALDLKNQDVSNKPNMGNPPIIFGGRKRTIRRKASTKVIRHRKSRKTNTKKVSRKKVNRKISTKRNSRKTSRKTSRKINRKTSGKINRQTSRKTSRKTNRRKPSRK